MKVMGSFVVILIILIAGVWIAVETQKKPCHFCEKRRMFLYRFRRADGGPDLRYSNNHLLCTTCGNKFGDAPVPASVVAELRRWRQDGYAKGLAGEGKDIPVEIRPLAGKRSEVSNEWYQGWHEGQEQYEWDTGFADGVAGRDQRRYGIGSTYIAAWIEGDAKRQGMHYFPARDASVKVKDSPENMIEG